MAVRVGGRSSLIKAAILVPYRAGDPDRDAAWEFVGGQLDRLGLTVVTGDSEGGWCRSQALNRAARDAGDWKVAFVTDADQVGTLTQIPRALTAAFRTGSYVVPRDRLFYLTKQQTRKVLSGELTLGEFNDEITEFTTMLWDGWFAIRRDRWDMLGGMDERIHGYGGQGVAFAAAAGTLFGRLRIAGDTFHLWHRQTRNRRRWIDRNAELVRAYHDADGAPLRMRRVLTRG